LPLDQGPLSFDQGPTTTWQRMCVIMVRHTTQRTYWIGYSTSSV